MTKLFTAMHGGRMRDTRHKLGQQRFKLSIRKNFFPLRTVRYWSRLPRELVQSPSWEVFKTKLDKDLSNLI